VAGAPQKVEGRVFDTAYSVTDAARTEPGTMIGRTPFELEEQQFSLLRNPSAGAAWLGVVGGAALALTLTVVGKLIANATFGKAAPEPWEYVALAVSAACLLVVLVAMAFVKTERSRLIELIKQHFEANPPRRVHVSPWEKK
jgi:hypothetical protein